uniref:Indoleamine 2,3-dioxyganese-III n=1 Tax=Blepharisma stoltei TaxID=1481888 RepID=A0A286T905_9CILI|nr:indoleamine 2,3-dioxyganese - III [Blepharisma stoltei]
MVAKCFQKSAALSPLSSFKLSITHGFINPNPPPSIPKHPELFPHYELAKSLASETSTIPSRIKYLPQIEASILFDDPEQLELSALIYGMLVSSYYWASPIPSVNIPSNIGVPFWKICQYLNRPPILNITSLEFHNFSYKSLAQDFHPDNLDCLFTFSGTSDEKYFYLIPLYVEYLGAPLLEAAFDLFSAIEERNKEEIIETLKIFKKTIQKMTGALNLMYEKCDPGIFYFGFRNKLKSYEKGAIFEGISEDCEIYSGASAAQSPIVRLIDIIFNLNQEHKFISKTYQYLKKEHRNFIFFINEKRPSFLRENIEDLGAKNEWNEVIDEICKFRETHLKLAYNYIIAPSQGRDNKGTGGSSLEQFLNTLITSTRRSAL